MSRDYNERHGYLDTRGLFQRRYNGTTRRLWSLVNCWREGSTLPYKGCSWILMTLAVGLTDGLGLDGDRCIRVIPRQVQYAIQVDITLISLGGGQSAIPIINIWCKTWGAVGVMKQRVVSGVIQWVGFMSGSVGRVHGWFSGWGSWMVQWVGFIGGSVGGVHEWFSGWGSWFMS